MLEHGSVSSQVVVTKIYKGPKLTTDYREILALPEVDPFALRRQRATCKNGIYQSEFG